MNVKLFNFLRRWLLTCCCSVTELLHCCRSEGWNSTEGLLWLCGGERGRDGPRVGPGHPGWDSRAWQVCQVDTGTRGVSAARNGRGAVCFYKSNPWHGELIIVKMRSKYPSSRSACWWQLWGHFWQTRTSQLLISPNKSNFTFSIAEAGQNKIWYF